MTSSNMFWETAQNDLLTLRDSSSMKACIELPRYPFKVQFQLTTVTSLLESTIAVYGGVLLPPLRNAISIR